MILLNRAHTNLQAVFTNAWLDDEPYESILDELFSLPDDCIQFIGACVDESTLPQKDEALPEVQLSLTEYMTLLGTVSLKDMLSERNYGIKKE
jgi:hypothetical protein